MAISVDHNDGAMSTPENRLADGAEKASFETSSPAGSDDEERGAGRLRRKSASGSSNGQLLKNVQVRELDEPGSHRLGEAAPGTLEPTRFPKEWRGVGRFRRPARMNGRQAQTPSGRGSEGEADG
jgi:hypothetical protein